MFPIYLSCLSWTLSYVQCDPEEAGSCDSGCNGGLMNSAFEYILKSGGVMREEDYPYSGADSGTCKFDKTKIAASVANFSVVSLDEDQIAANLVKNGPLAGEYTTTTATLNYLLCLNQFHLIISITCLISCNFQLAQTQWPSMQHICRHISVEYHAHTYVQEGLIMGSYWWDMVLVPMHPFV